MARRIAPYVRDVVDAREGSYVELAGGRVLRDAAARARDRVSALLGGAESVTRSSDRSSSESMP